MSDSNSYGFGGKLIGAVVLALLGGYVWACIEMGRSPLAIVHLFDSKEEPEAAKPAPPPRKELPKPEPIAAKKPEPPKAVEPPVARKVEPAPAVGPRPYSAVD